MVDGENDLLTLARYIVLNPVRARMVEVPGQWPWSSDCVTAGLEPAPPWLHADSILDRFDEWDRNNVAALYRAFVAEGIGRNESPSEHITAGLYLEGEAFIERVRNLTRDREWKRNHSPFSRM